MPGVVEDVTDIILNLKEVRLRLHAEGPKVLRVHKKGAGTLTAADLHSDDQTIEILNPDHKIATLAPEADPSTVAKNSSRADPTSRQRHLGPSHVRSALS